MSKVPFIKYNQSVSDLRDISPYTVFVQTLLLYSSLIMRLIDAITFPYRGWIQFKNPHLYSKLKFGVLID